MPLSRASVFGIGVGINPHQPDNIAGFYISDQIARHGGNAEGIRPVSGKVLVGDFLLSKAADLGSDMIIMGTYGHSRQRECMFGVASRYILECTTVLVFMSH